MGWPSRFLCPWDFPGKNTGVGSCSLLQGIFPTQGSNRGLLHCRQILYQLSHQGKDNYLFTQQTFPKAMELLGFCWALGIFAASVLKEP